MICGWIPTETGNRRRQQSNVSDFKNLIEAGATIVYETMGIKKICKSPARAILEKTH